jgi:antitoxin component of MazEF toxin-antitoxin module
MIKQLSKVGNSSAVILDRAIMELVGLEEGAEVQLTVHNGSLIITPANPKVVDQERFEECLSRVASSRRDLLRKLAE